MRIQIWLLLVLLFSCRTEEISKVKTYYLKGILIDKANNLPMKNVRLGVSYLNILYVDTLNGTHSSMDQYFFTDSNGYFDIRFSDFVASRSVEKITIEYNESKLFELYESNFKNYDNLIFYRNDSLRLQILADQSFILNSDSIIIYFEKPAKSQYKVINPIPGEIFYKRMHKKNLPSSFSVFNFKNSLVQKSAYMRYNSEYFLKLDPDTIKIQLK